MTVQVDTEALIAEVKELFNEGWCLCRRSGLGDRVLDALESASSPRTVTTVEELDGLPVGSVVHVFDKRAGDRSVWELFDDVLDLIDSDGEKPPRAWASPAYKSEALSIDLVDFAGGQPISVLWTPTEGSKP